MKTSLRFLAGTVAMAAVSIFVSGCDASPYAANVDGQVIKSLSLNGRLAQYASNKAYVTAEDQASKSSSGGTAISGAGSGTYNSTFVSDILSQMIVDSILHQHLAASGQLPSPAMLAAARGVYEAGGSSSYWYGFPDQLRDALAQSLAQQAAVIQPSTDTSTLQQGYSQLQPYLFTQLCVSQSSAFSAAAAQTVASAGVPDGTTVCYDQATLEDQAASYRTAVFALAVGKVSKPISSSFGYQVVKLVSKQTIPFNTDTSRVLTLILDSNNGVALPALSGLVTKADVKINPAYGTWDAKSGSVQPPQTQG